MKYLKYNANPKNKRTGDCVIRALTVALDKKYEDVAKDLFEFSMKTYYSMNSKENFSGYLSKQGYLMQRMPKREDGTRYTVEEFIDELAEVEGIYIVSVANHLTCIKNEQLIDIWDCSKKSVGNYWKIK